MDLHPRRLACLGLALVAAAGASSLATAADPATGLKAEYFDAIDMTGAPVVTRVDPKIDFNWGLSEPVPGVGDTFSVRWKGTIAPRYTERYTLFVTSDDGVRLYIDGQLVLDKWTMHSVETNSTQVDLVADRKHEIEMEFYDGVRHAVARLEWRSASQQRQVVPTDRLAPPADAPPLPVSEGSGDTGAVAPGTPATTTAAPLPEPAKTAVGDTAVTTAVPDGPLPPPAPPVPGETFNAEPGKGDVLVRRPGDGTLIPLEQGASLPVGTRVDSREGSVSIETAPAAGVPTNQHAAFGGATFRVSQPRDGGRVVTLDMMHGDFESCVSSKPRRYKKGKARSAARKKRSGARAARKSVRELWGSGKGRFRTRGRHAAATVRGTEWSIEDRCDATVVRVRSGVVDVEDFATGRTVAVRAGESHVAAP